MSKYREAIIEGLIEDYADYLSDFSTPQLVKIKKNGVFTIKEVRMEEYRKDLLIK